MRARLTATTAAWLAAFLACFAATADATGWHHASGADCQGCHAPGEARGAQSLPDWNGTAIQAYAPYGSASFDGAATAGQPGPASLMCLSCHDGTVGLARSHSDRRLDPGADLSDDHPIGFVYDAALAAADGGLHDPATHPSGLGGTIAHDLLANGRVECTSCHAQHTAVASNAMLARGNEGSALCLTCHAK